METVSDRMRVAKQMFKVIHLSIIFLGYLLRVSSIRQLDLKS